MAVDVSRSGAVARALRGHDLDDREMRRRLGEITVLAATLCRTPLAALSVNDGGRERFIACHGFSLDEADLENSFAAYVMNTSEPLVVSDVSEDSRFRDAPLVEKITGLHYYAGIPVATDGITIGTLAVMDRSGRRLANEQLSGLSLLAGQAVTQLTLQRQMRPKPPPAPSADEVVDFRVLFESVPGLYWVVKPEEFRFVAASDAFLKASMSRRGEIMGRPLFNVFPTDPNDPSGEEGAHNLKASLEQVKATGRQDEMAIQRYAIPRPLERGGGFEERYWSAVNAPVLDDDGRLRYIIHRTEDVTELVQLKRGAGDGHQLQRLQTRAEKMEADIVRRSQEMKRLNEHLRFAQQVANIGSWEFDVNDEERTWSDEVYRILGIERDSMPESPETIASVVHPEDLHLLTEARNQALAGELTEFEHRIVRPDGEQRFVRERAQLILDENGEPQRLFGTIQDITEQRLTEERLRKSEHLLRIAGQMAKMGAWQLDVPEQKVIWSEEVCAIHGIEPCESIELRAAIDFVAPEYQEMVTAALDACVNEGRPYDLEFQIVTARGTRVWARTMGQAVRGANGDVACIQGALQDITQQKQAEADVRALSARLTTTLENITDAFLTLDNEWRVTFLNKHAEHILGKSREELLGKDIWDAYPDTVGTTFYREYHRARDEGKTASFEEYYPPLDAWLEVTAYPSSDGLAIYFRDITERMAMQEAARSSEERTRRIVETALDAVISITSESVITGWNQRAENTFGWSREEAVGKHLYDLIIPEEYREAHRRGVAHFLETGEGPLLNQRVEVDALHRDGHEFPVELAISPIFSGDTVTFSAFLRDITERKKAESAVRESEERFRMVAKATADTVWDWNLATDAIWWNDGIQTVFGYRPEDVEPDSRSRTKRVHPDDLDRVVNGIQKVINGEADSWSDEYRFRCKNGSYAYVIDRGFGIRDNTGKTIRMIGGMNDISERKEYETKLREQAALLDKAQDAIIVRDMDNRITYWNKGAERLYGWTAEEAVGRRMQELLRPPPDVFYEASRQVLRDGDWSGEIVKKRKDGETIDVHGAWSLVRDDYGKPESVLTIDTNITERVALEEQLRQSQRLESVGQLTGGVAHDFNNLLTVILGNAELMMDQLPEDSRLRKLAAMSRTAAQRGSELTHRLLAFARRQALEPGIVDVNELVIGMEDLLRRTLLENIDIEIIPTEGAWSAFVDPAQLESVLLNLTINAKDAMPDGGQLTIETANVQLDEDYAAQHAEVVPGRYVMIAVSDTGSGIPTENLDRVFDPFFTTKEKGKGTGLGLSMAYGFAKQSEGHIKIYSEPGQGTTVKVYLPRAEQPADLVDPGLAEQNNLTGSEKVLIVEDDDLVREHAQAQLAELGYDVLAARNGPEAMEIIKKESDIDLLFTDVIMSGGMNGRDLAEMARRLRPKLKVLYTSGYTENAIVHHGRLDRGVQLLQKPYQRADLAKKLRSVLNHSSPGEQRG